MPPRRAELRSNQPARAAASEGSPWPRLFRGVRFSLFCSVFALPSRSLRPRTPGFGWMMQQQVPAVPPHPPTPAEDSIKCARALVSRSLGRRVSPSPSSGATMLGQVPLGRVPRNSRLRLMTPGFFADHQWLTTNLLVHIGLVGGGLFVKLRIGMLPVPILEVCDMCR